MFVPPNVCQGFLVVSAPGGFRGFPGVFLGDPWEGLVLGTGNFVAQGNAIVGVEIVDAY